jgi:hypothetical protein
VAFVSVPKDLSRVKTKILLNLTRRQLICFGTAAATGIPVYIFTRGAIGNSAAAFLMMALMLPLFLLAMYEKDGQPAEKLLRNYLRTSVFWRGKRVYKTENLYDIIAKEGKAFAEKSKGAAKAPFGAGAASKRKPRRAAKSRAE